MSATAEQRNQKRKEVVEAIVVGQEPAYLVSRIYNIPLRTLFNRSALYRSGGWDALKEIGHSGRPKKLNGFEMQWIYEVVSKGSPDQYKFDFCLLTRNALRALIKRELKVELSKESLSRLLKNLGLSSQQPIFKSYKQDPRKIKKYMEETFPDAMKQAEEIGAAIYFLDEASIMRPIQKKASLIQSFFKMKDTKCIIDAVTA